MTAGTTKTTCTGDPQATSDDAGPRAILASLNARFRKLCWFFFRLDPSCTTHTIRPILNTVSTHFQTTCDDAIHPALVGFAFGSPRLARHTDGQTQRPTVQRTASCGQATALKKFECQHKHKCM